MGQLGGTFSICVGVYTENKAKCCDSCSGLGVGEFPKPVPGEVPEHPQGGAIWTLKVL